MLLFPQLPQIKLDPFVFTPYFEARERYQRRTAKGFSTKVHDSTSVFESRYRVGFTVTDNKQFTGKAIYQYAHTLQWAAAKNNSFQGSDLYVGEGDWKLDKNNTLRLGRQIILKGGSRLFEESFFGQRSKSFDVARVQGTNYDVWGGRVGLSPVAQDHAEIAGASYDWPSNIGESMVVFKHDQWLTKENFWTFDHRDVLTFGHGRQKTEAELEGAFQKGRYTGLNLNSYFLHARIGRGLAKSWGTYIEGNIFSGGKNSTSTQGFDNLYGATHDFLGRMDVVGTRNIENIELAATYKGIPKLQLGVTYNHFWLVNASDGLYSTTNGSLYSVGGHKAIDTNGQSGRDVGQEENLLARYDFNKNLWVGSEIGFFQPGGFIKKIVGPGNTSQFWGMIYINLKF